MITRSARSTNYQKKNTNQGNQYQILKKLFLSFKDQKTLFNYCKKKKIKFLSTAFDLKSLDFLLNLGVDYIKIPSGEITNYLLLKKISKINKRVILSTGASTFKEITAAVKILKLKNSFLTIMHCNSAYPTPLKDVNLNVLCKMEKKYNCSVGYSDHTLSLAVPVGAVALGAKFIEKHFTLSRKLKGPDHNSSLEPHELSQMIKLIREIELSKGGSKKLITKSELDNRKLIRKSIVASEFIKKGHLITKNNIIFKRPGDGISPMSQKNIIGKKAIKNFHKDEKIKI